MIKHFWMWYLTFKFLPGRSNTAECCLNRSGEQILTTSSCPIQNAVMSPYCACRSRRYSCRLPARAKSAKFPSLTTQQQNNRSAKFPSLTTQQQNNRSAKFISSMYFCYFDIISPWKRVGPFILTKRSNEMLTSATGSGQVLVSVWVTGPGHIFSKITHDTSKRAKNATNFSFKFLNDFHEVCGLSPDILTLVKKEAMGNTRILLIYYQ